MEAQDYLKEFYEGHCDEDARLTSRHGMVEFLTLLLGPMYHLHTAQEQKTALAEAIRVTKPGGVVFAAYCGNDATVIQACFGRGFLKEPRYKALTDLNTFQLSSTPAELFAMCERPDLVGASNHFLDIFQKQ